MRIEIAMLALVLLFGLNQINSTEQCPENYYDNGFSDLLDRGWCDYLKKNGFD